MASESKGNGGSRKAVTPAPFGWGSRKNAVPPQHLYDGGAARGVAMMAYQSGDAQAPAAGADAAPPRATVGASTQPRRINAAQAAAPAPAAAAGTAVPASASAATANQRGSGASTSRHANATAVSTGTAGGAAGGGTVAAGSGSGSGSAASATPFGWGERHNAVPPAHLHDGGAARGVAMQAHQDVAGSAHEDARLAALVNKHGAREWSGVAAALPKASGEECRDRCVTRPCPVGARVCCHRSVPCDLVASFLTRSHPMHHLHGGARLQVAQAPPPFRHRG